METINKDVAGNRVIHEKVGMYYEEFVIGDVVEHWPGRTISEADNTWFTLLTMNRHPVHFDDHHAKSTHFGKVLVNSCLTLSIITGMTVNILSAKAIANLGWDQVKLPAPVFVGDTLYARSEVTLKRKSSKHSDRGIITIKMTGYNQNKQIIFEGTRTFMVPCEKGET
ncbi:MaoC family dehydratase [Brevibacillus sp. SYSU BS000544]|uniref:MaoC family dehydratase n=1 Tax=Brevibacillus sp. SYSU BS000544 TaxID=3416443 RepID=UPI003CE59A5C